MAQMQFDFDGLISLLAHHLYTDKRVFLRELIQNAHDGVARRRSADQQRFEGRIDIETWPNELRIRFTDDGLGMDKDDLAKYLSTIGSSRTREEKTQTVGLIGEFGIGFLSAFVVAKRVEVRTRKVGDDLAWLWVNEGSNDYQLEPCDRGTPGTTVDVFLKSADDRGLIDVEEVRSAVHRYADMLQVPIHVNGGDAVNVMQMPWERRGVDYQTLKFDCYVYLERTMEDSVLEAMPILSTDGVPAAGVLYLTRTRTLGIESPRKLHLFKDRMFVTDQANDLLPKWATFVNGMVNATDLTLTAARDNYVEDAAAKNLRETLGSLVLQRLGQLFKEDRPRFNDIQKYHELGIKAACFYYDDFYAEVWDVLQWRVNGGGADTDIGGSSPRATLPEILAKITKGPDGMVRLPCFTTGSSANQYFEMADAAGTVVVDASFVFEAPLLERYVKGHPGVRLVHVDREDDPSVFRRLAAGESEDVARLAETMARVIRPGGARIQCEARRFKPARVPAIIRSDPRTVGQARAYELLNDPNVTDNIREMALELARLSRQEALKLTINADNPLVMRLAKHPLDAPTASEIMLGLYNNAILVNEELMTSQNARIFHDQFQILMERALDYMDLDATLSRPEHAVRGVWADGADSRFMSAFLMTPFDPSFQRVVAGLRDVVEAKWGFRLFVASDRQYDHRLLENIERHLDQAAFLVAEVTDANPNVMFELGAAFAKRQNRPVILLRQGRTHDEKRLPADLTGLLWVDYAVDVSNRWVSKLERELLKNASLQKLIGDKAREHYLAPAALRLRTRFQQLDDTVLSRVAEAIPTEEAWARVEEPHVRALLGDDADLAGAFLERVQRSAPPVK